MDDVQALLEQLQQLKAANEQLRDQLQERSPGTGPVPDPVPGPSTVPSNINPINEATNVCYVYAPRERKCPRFTGKLSVDLLTVDQWVEEVRRCLEIRPMSRAAQVMFVMDHLDGSAKSEVCFHSSTSRDTPDKIFDILVENYSCTQSYVAAQLQFFQRTQREGESLRDYSHALKSLMDTVICKTPGGIPNSDILLRDQFTEHVHDDMLRRELKQRVLQTPDMSFLALRSIALKWADVGRQGGKTRSRVYSCDTNCQVVEGVNAEMHAVTLGPNDDILQIKECLRKQQVQLDTLMKQMSVHFSQPSQTELPPTPPTTRPFRFQADGKPICHRCGRAGHIARFCRVKHPAIKNSGGSHADAHVQSQVVEQGPEFQPSGN